MKKVKRNKIRSYHFLIIGILIITVLSLTGCTDRIKRNVSNLETVEKETVCLAEETEKQQSQESSEYMTEDSTENEMSTESQSIEETEMMSKEIVIELDPGHGGNQPGAENKAHGVLEKDINLKIAQYLKAELENYEHVTVYMTREDDTAVELESRIAKAVEDQADIIISLHNNAAGPMADYDHGCTVIVPRGVYRENVSLIGQEMGCCILKALSDIGLENQGLMFRICQNETTYSNGELCDYYSIIRNSVKAGIPGIIVEHSFLDNENDYADYLESDEKLRTLAQADAKGIAAYYGLRSKITGQVPEPLKNYEEKITIIKSDDNKDNEHLKKMYFLE